MSIKEYRRKKGINQAALAKAIGVAPSIISRYENGIIYPSMSKLKKIANYLEVSLDELLDNDVSDKKQFEKQTNETLMGPWDAAIGEAKKREEIRKRNVLLVDKLIYHLHGICELCNQPAPFSTEDGRPYLEHYSLELYHMEQSSWLRYIPDWSYYERVVVDPEKMVVLCPNCYQKIRVLHRKEDIEYLEGKAKNHSEFFENSSEG